MAKRAATGDAGFTLVEVVIALLVLSVGLLALAGTTGAIFTQMRVAERRTERATAVQQIAERFYSVPEPNLATECTALNEQVGQYTMSCESELSGNLYLLRLISEGPGYRSGDGWQSDVVDTLAVYLSR